MLVLKDIRFVVRNFQVSTVARLEVIMVKPGWVIRQDRVTRKEACVIGLASYSEVENYGSQCLL